MNCIKIMQDLLSPPTPEELENMPELVKYEFNIREPKRMLYSLD